MVKKMLLSFSAYLLLQGTHPALASQLRSSKKNKSHMRIKESAIAKEHTKRIQDDNLLFVMVQTLIQSRKNHREKKDGSGLIDMSVPFPLACLPLFPYLCGKASAKFLGYQFVPEDLYTDEFLLNICQAEEHKHKS
jgi:hypothetical protein